MVDFPAHKFTNGLIDSIMTGSQLKMIRKVVVQRRRIQTIIYKNCLVKKTGTSYICIILTEKLVLKYYIYIILLRHINNRKVCYYFVLHSLTNAHLSYLGQHQKYFLQSNFSGKYCHRCH